MGESATTVQELVLYRRCNHDNASDLWDISIDFASTKPKVNTAVAFRSAAGRIITQLIDGGDEQTQKEEARTPRANHTWR